MQEEGGPVPASQLTIHARPQLKDTRMILGLSGWMDGGDVSTGAIECLVTKLGADRLAEIHPEDFYLYSFPGSMEISAMFRPYCRIEDGLVEEFRPASNVFYYDEANGLILFEGKEPNFRWREYVECIFAVVSEFDVREMYFIGSVAGVVPHTREPRLFSSVSEEALKERLEPYGVRFSNYAGPASVATFMTTVAADKALPMVTLVAEIPAYIQGRNPRCIEAVARHLSALLGLQVQLDDLRTVSNAFERRLNELVAKRPELAELIRKLESDYDSEIFDTQMGDLKAWLQQQGIRLD
jgi:proteasome assembly chaperone (PAC2) family protein